MHQTMKMGFPHICCRHGGRSNSNPDPYPPLNFLGPVEGGVGRGGGVLRGVGGAQWGGGGVPGTPTNIPQNDPLVALIISNTHMSGVLKKFLPPGDPIPAARFWGGGGGLGGVGGSGVKKFFLFCMDN